MIPKISNYKEVILNDDPPIFDKEYSSFDFIFNKEKIILPYYETIIDNQNRDELFKVLNNKSYKKFCSSMNVIGVTEIDNSFYYTLILNDEVISYVSIKDGIILSYDCIPRYQKQGYIGIILRFLFKSGSKIEIYKNNPDMNTLYKLSKTMFPEKSIVKNYKENSVELYCDDIKELIYQEYNFDKLCYSRRFCYHGILAYTENYKIWFP